MNIGFLENLTGLGCMEKVWAALTLEFGKYGFDRLLYGYTHFRSENSWGNPEDFLILSNHGDDYLDPFLSKKMYLDAPMVQWAINNTGSRSWRHLDEMVASGQLSPKQIEVLEFNRKMGVSSGYSLSFQSVSTRAKGGLALTASPDLTQGDVDEVWKNHGSYLTVVANVAHLKLINLPNTGQRRALTKRQREVLEWVGEGKSMQDVACILGVSTATVEKHLRLARLSLDVETTAQALLKASFQNQIYTLVT